MYWLAAVQQTSTTKLTAFFQNFSKRVWWLRNKENKVTTENAFNRKYFRNESNW